MERTHNTNKSEIDLNRKYPENGEMDLKPKGLWYGINKEWIGWCKSEEPDWIRANMFKLTLNFNGILVLKTREDIEKFHEEYRSDNNFISFIN